MSDKRLWITAALCTVCILTLTARLPGAAPLTPPGGTLSAAGVIFPGGIELDSVCHANVVSANLVVNVASAVYESELGTLDFYYQVSNNSEHNWVHRVTASNFVGFLTNIDYVIDGVTIACQACPGGFFQPGTQDPLTVDRDGFGEVAGFNFPTPDFEVDPGEASQVLMVRTDATAYDSGFVSVINSGTVTLSAFKPALATTNRPRTKSKKPCA